MTGCASTAAVVTRLIVCPWKRKQRIEKPRFLQSKKNRVGPQLCAETSITEFDLGLAGILAGIRIADLRPLAPASLKNTKHVPWLRDLPALEWLQVGQN